MGHSRERTLLPVAFGPAAFKQWPLFVVVVVVEQVSELALGIALLNDRIPFSSSPSFSGGGGGVVLSRAKGTLRAGALSNSRSIRQV